MVDQHHPTVTPFSGTLCRAGSLICDLDLNIEKEWTCGSAARAEDQQQMSALFGLARAFSRYDSNRAFGVVEPLIDQLNELSASASVLNGFGQKYYEDGDLIVDNGNPVGNAANELANTLGSLALTDFERAKAAADQIRPADIRVRAYMAIAEQAIQSSPSR